MRTKFNVQKNDCQKNDSSYKFLFEYGCIPNTVLTEFGFLTEQNPTLDKIVFSIKC